MTVNNPYQNVTILQCLANKFDYSLGFTVEDKEHLVIYFGKGDIFKIAEGVDYTISDVAGFGYDTVTLVGNVTVGLSADHKIAIKRRVTSAQNDQYDDFIDGKVLGAYLDRIAKAIADLGRDVDNSLQFPIDENSQNISHKPIPVDRANMILSFDADGKLVAELDATGIAEATQYAAAADLSRVAAAAAALAAAASEGAVNDSALAAAASALAAADSADDVLAWAVAVTAAASGDALHANVFVSPKILATDLTILPTENAIGLFERIDDGVVLDVAGTLSIIN